MGEEEREREKERNGGNKEKKNEKRMSSQKNEGRQLFVFQSKKTDKEGMLALRSQ